MTTTTLGGGCFWCLEAVFQKIKGVNSVTSGYAGGQTANPDYRSVCADTTGHAEVVRIDYDPAVVSFEDLLTVFFVIHDPTTLNRQGADVGTQYRSIILWEDEAQRETAEAVIAQLAEAGAFSSAIVTQVEPLTQFYPAEDYHQDYYLQNAPMPYCQVVIEPKLAKAREKFRELMAG